MLKKKFLSVAAAACLVLPAGSAFAGEAPAPERTRMDIVGMDYHFMLADGSEFPRRLAKGDYRFTFRNDSEKRFHEVVIFKCSTERSCTGSSGCPRRGRSDTSGSWVRRSPNPARKRRGRSERH
jgi:hypothetical protein